MPRVRDPLHHLADTAMYTYPPFADDQLKAGNSPAKVKGEKDAAAIRPHSRTGLLAASRRRQTLGATLDS